MRRNGCTIGITSGVIFLALVFTLSIGDAIASECVRCHTKRDNLKVITDALPKKVKSSEISGQG